MPQTTISGNADFSRTPPMNGGVRQFSVFSVQFSAGRSNSSTPSISSNIVHGWLQFHSALGV